MPGLQFYPLDIAYTVKNNKTLILLFGRTLDNKAICIIDSSFLPYFYIMLKKGSSSDLFKDRIKGLVKKDDEDEEIEYSILSAEIIKKKYSGDEKELIKVSVNIPKAIHIFEDILKNREDIECILETDIRFTKKYLIERNIIPFTLYEAGSKEAFTGFGSIKADYIIKLEKDEENDKKTGKSQTGSDRIKQVSEDHLPHPKILAFGIETYNAGSINKAIAPADKAARAGREEFPILMASFYGDEGKFKKVITWKRFDAEEKSTGDEKEKTWEYTEFVNSESDLIARFKEIIVKYRPDILAGYFSDSFDMPYIKTRASKYKIGLNFGLDSSEPKEVRIGNMPAVQIRGINHIDIFKFVKFYMRNMLKTDKFNLNSVAEKLINEKKKEADMAKLADAWDNAENEPDKLREFCGYNLQDSALVYRLFNHIYPNLVELAKMTGLTLFEISRMSYSQIVEQFLIKQAFAENEIIPKKPSREEKIMRKGNTYRGGFVFEPVPGLYNEIAVFDFRSLYPTIIAAHNISPETVNTACGEDEKNYAPEKESGEKIWFCRDKKGFMPKIIREIISRRIRINEMMKESERAAGKKDLLLEARSNNLKILANSFYGYLGYYLSRWYSLKCAKAVTAWGRHYIKEVIESAKNENFEVLYSDTDSIFISLKDFTRDDALKFMEKINLKLNEFMELELEGFYKRGIFVPVKAQPSASTAVSSAPAASAGAKKRYALVDEKNNLIVAGFETVRKNWSSLAKRTQEEVLKMILIERDIKKAKAYVCEVIEKLENKEIPNEELVITIQLSKEIKDYDQIGPHVMAAKRMEKGGIPAGAGTIVRYIISEGDEMIRDRARLPDEIDRGKYDAEYYIFNQIIPAVESIFNVIGINILEEIEQKGQSKLDVFI